MSCEDLSLLYLVVRFPLQPACGEETKWAEKREWSRESAGELRGRAEKGQVESPRALGGTCRFRGRGQGSRNRKGQTVRQRKSVGLGKPDGMGKLATVLVTTLEQGPGQPYHQAFSGWWAFWFHHRWIWEHCREGRRTTSLSCSEQELVSMAEDTGVKAMVHGNYGDWAGG